MCLPFFCTTNQAFCVFQLHLIPPLMEYSVKLKLCRKQNLSYARIFIIAVIRDPGVFYEFPLQQIEALDLLCYILYKNFVITQYIKAWGT